ncbi:hypothetical protein ACXA45_11225 [Neomicrococcus lactis]
MSFKKDFPAYWKCATRESYAELNLEATADLQYAGLLEMPDALKQLLANPKSGSERLRSRKNPATYTDQLAYGRYWGILPPFTSAETRAIAAAAKHMDSLRLLDKYSTEYLVYESEPSSNKWLSIVEKIEREIKENGGAGYYDARRGLKKDDWWRFSLLWQQLTDSGRYHHVKEGRRQELLAPNPVAYPVSYSPTPEKFRENGETLLLSTVNPEATSDARVLEFLGRADLRPSQELVVGGLEYYPILRFRQANGVRFAGYEVRDDADAVIDTIYTEYFNSTKWINNKDNKYFIEFDQKKNILFIRDYKLNFVRAFDITETPEWKEVVDMFGRREGHIMRGAAISMDAELFVLAFYNQVHVFGLDGRAVAAYKVIKVVDEMDSDYDEEIPEEKAQVVASSIFSDWVYSVDLSPDGKKIAIGSYAGNLYEVVIATGETHKWEFEGTVLSLQFTADGIKGSGGLHAFFLHN